MRSRILAVAPVLALGLAASPAAEASFGGKIKNIRVRQRGSGSGYRVVVVVQDDAEGATVDSDLDMPDGMQVSFTPVDGGPALEALETATFERQTATYRWSNTIRNWGRIRGSSGRTWDCALNDDGSWDEATPDEELTAACRFVDEDGDGVGTLEVKVQGQARDFDLSTLGTLEWAPLQDDGTAGTFTAGTLSRTRARARLALTPVDGSADPSGFAYQMAVSLTEGGATLDSLSQTITASADAPVSGIIKDKISQKRNGDLKHVVITRSSEPGGAAGLDSAIVDGDTGGVVLEAVGDAPIATSRAFDAAAFGFDDSPAGNSYAFTLTARDSTGATIGTPGTGTMVFATDGTPKQTTIKLGGETSMDVIVENLEDEDETQDNPVRVGAGVSGPGAGTVASLELQFDEPFEGPTPQENPLTLEFSCEQQRWVHTASISDGVPTSGFEIDTLLLDEDGSLIEQLVWDGDFGDRQFSNGKGTRPPCSNTSTSADLL